ncbi:MAG: PD-(D/E)XK nuclease family protein [Patescibacteria group bacterium]|nr:PD-(D/E)XK nuclease family protein [Patescibacteria group bacterium]
MADSNNDKYTAVWVSHSSISDFLKCPRAYFLKNVYRDPASGHKIKLISPPLSLGQAVHEVVESLSSLPVEDRLRRSLSEEFETAWRKISGKKGGFSNDAVEKKYKDRGKAMLKRILDNPGPIKKLAVKIKANLPYFWLSEKDNIILCGKIDWLEYLPETEAVHIIDFKTGKNKEYDSSLQLPIYLLLVSNCQDRPVEKASYWYLEGETGLEEQKLPQADSAYNQILKIAKEIKLARQLGRFKCPQEDGCPVCRPFEAILQEKAELVGTDEFHSDVYILRTSFEGEKEKSVLF